MGMGMPGLRPGQQMGGDIYFPNQMGPPMQQSQPGINPQIGMGGISQQGPQQGMFPGGPRGYPPRTQIRHAMDMSGGIPPQVAQNMNPMHRASPGMPGGPGGSKPPPSTSVNFGAMRQPLPPQQSCPPMPMGMPQHNQSRPWPPVTGSGPAAYSTPPPGSAAPGYPLTPSSGIGPQPPPMQSGMLTSPGPGQPQQQHQDMNGNDNNFGMQRLPSQNQMQSFPGQSHQPPQQQMDMNQMPPSSTGNISTSQAPTPHARVGPQTPQQQTDMNGSSSEIKQETSQLPQQSSGPPSQGTTATANGTGPHPNGSNGDNGHSFDMFSSDFGGNGNQEKDAIMAYSRSLKDECQRLERSQLTPGSSGPNSVQAQQTNGGAPQGLERPHSSGGGINGGSDVPPAPQQQQQQQQTAPQSIVTSQGQPIEYLFST